MPVLPRLRNYDAIYRQFRWQVPARYNIGVDVCDRWAAPRARPARHPACACPTAAKTPSATAACARSRTGSPMCCARMASRAATASPSCCRRHRKSPPPTSRSTSSARIALPLAVLFGPDALLYRLQNSGAAALITNAQGVVKLDRRVRDGVPDLTCVLSLDGAGDGADFSECWRVPRPISRRSTHRPTIRR